MAKLMTVSICITKKTTSLVFRQPPLHPKLQRFKTTIYRQHEDNSGRCILREPHPGICIHSGLSGNRYNLCFFVACMKMFNSRLQNVCQVNAQSAVYPLSSTCTGIKTDGKPGLYGYSVALSNVINGTRSIMVRHPCKCMCSNSPGLE
jgi:hypothetical protein